MVINTKKRELESIKRMKEKKERNKNNNKKSDETNLEEPKVEGNFAQQNKRVCYICRDPNHLSPN